jgi:hypothetical protein
MVVHAYEPIFGKLSQEDLGFKYSLIYIASSKLTLDTQ